MHILKFIILLSLSARPILANHNSKLRQLIVRAHHGSSDSKTVYFIGSDKEFLSDFIKNEVSIPISIFNTNFKNDLRQSVNVIIVYQVPDKDKHNSHLNLLQKIVKSLQVRKFAILSASSMEILKKCFTFFHELHFKRIFGILSNTSSYSYIPFAQNPIQHLIENEVQLPLPDGFKDLNGLAIRTSVYRSDFPRVFWYTHTNGEKRIGGTFGQIFLQFLKRHNATFLEILANNDSSRVYYSHDTVNAYVNDEIDISMSSFTPCDYLDLSYPIMFQEYVLMVPRNGYLNPMEYFHRPFKPTAWLCIGLAIIFITISKVALNSLTNSRPDIWGSFAEIYLTLLSSSPGRPIVTHYRFHLVVIVFGFIFERLYGIHFQSFLTVYIKIKQYDTVQDLLDNNVHILIPHDAWEMLKDHGYPNGFDEIAIPIDFVEFLENYVSMKNTSFAYAADADRCDFFVGYQSLFRKSLFRKAKEIIARHHIGYLLPFHSLFKEILNDFIIGIKETGLIQKWDSDVMYFAKAAGFRMGTGAGGVDEDLSNKPLSMYHLKFAWLYLTVGLTFAIVVFVLELTWSFMKEFK